MDQPNLQTEIRKIQRDENLSSAEKSKSISELMHNSNKKSSTKVVEKKNNQLKICNHYIRGCDIQCVECNNFVKCRICVFIARQHQETETASGARGGTCATD